MASDLRLRAEALHGPWQLPFEWTDLAPHCELLHPAVVAEDGTVYGATEGAGPAEREVMSRAAPLGRRFAWVVAARVNGRDHVLPTAAFAEEEAAAWLAGRSEERACWLLRAEGAAGRVSLCCHRGPEPVAARRIPTGPVDLLCDLGMVLCRFDRAAFARNFAAVFGFPLPAGCGAWLTPLRLGFERGQLDEDRFAEEMLSRLGLAAPDRAALERVWASIFTPEAATLHLVRRLAAVPGTELVVVSNTDPWALRGCRDQLGLTDLLRDAVASFQDGVNPKGEDASMWQRARAVAATRRGAPGAFAVAVDDVRDYLRQAQAAGVVDAVCHAAGHPSLAFGLARLGL
jgi:FMN phosphatase YigB (HAD superfamily)